VQKVADILGAALAAFAGLVGAAVVGTLNGIADMLPKLGDGIKLILDALAGAGNGQQTEALKTLGEGLAKIGEGAASIPLDIAERVGKLLGIDVKGGLKAWDGIKQNAETIFSEIFGDGGIISTKIADFKKSWDKFWADIGTGIKEAITKPFEDAVNSIKATFIDTINKLRGLVGMGPLDSSGDGGGKPPSDQQFKDQFKPAQPYTLPQKPPQEQQKTPAEIAIQNAINWVQGGGLTQMNKAISDFTKNALSAMDAAGMQQLGTKITGAIQTGITWLNGDGATLAGLAATALINTTDPIFGGAGKPLVGSVRAALFEIAQMFKGLPLGVGGGIGKQIEDAAKGGSGRAFGGMVVPGSKYNILEKGKPEVFFPDTSGRIVPLDKLGAGGGGGSAPVYITLNANGVNDPVQLVNLVDRELSRRNKPRIGGN
jgi:hypothetical protein